MRVSLFDGRASRDGRSRPYVKIMDTMPPPAPASACATLSFRGIGTLRSGLLMAGASVGVDASSDVEDMALMRVCRCDARVHDDVR